MLFKVLGFSLCETRLTLVLYLFFMLIDVSRRSPVKTKIVGKQKKESKSDWLVSGKKDEFDDSNLDATRTSKVNYH